MPKNRNNKKLTLAFLAIIAAIIWVYNGYKIMHGMAASDNALTLSDNDDMNPAALCDSSAFLWRYPAAQRDPFRTVTTAAATIVMEKPATTEKRDKTLAVQVSGIIRNAGGDLVILRDNQDRVYFLPEDGILDSVSVAAVYSDSVILLCKGRTYCFPL